MEIYNTEEEQVEALKAWWSEYGKAIIGGVVLAIVLVSGWRYYQSYRLQKQELASAQYSQIVKSLNSEGVKAYPADYAFIQEHGSDTYAALAGLSLAKNAVSQGQLDEAVKALTTVVNNADSILFKATAAVRLARIELEQGKFDMALSRLTGLNAKGYQGEIAEIKGDIYLKQNKPDMARKSYQEAADAQGLPLRPTLRLKMEDLTMPASATIADGESHEK